MKTELKSFIKPVITGTLLGLLALVVFFGFVCVGCSNDAEKSELELRAERERETSPIDSTFPTWNELSRITKGVVYEYQLPEIGEIHYYTNDTTGCEYTLDSFYLHDIWYDRYELFYSDDETPASLKEYLWG